MKAMNKEEQRYGNHRTVWDISVYACVFFNLIKGKATSINQTGRWHADNEQSRREREKMSQLVYQI